MPTKSRTKILLASDKQHSVLNALDVHGAHANTYTAYGHCGLTGLLSLLGFNGELMNTLTGHYLLGNGYRPFSPVLMRFICPDSWSPFGEGGINAYSYCGGDPINHNDSTGHMFPRPRLPAPVPPPRPQNTEIIRARKVASPSTPALSSRRRSDTFDALLSTRRKTTDPIINSSQKQDFIGYHGSTKEHAKNLSSGLNNRFIGSRNGIDSGRGFYLTPDYKSAAGWANTSKRAEASTPQVYGVYAKNFNTLKPGRDYRLNTELNPSLKDHVQIIIKESAYSSISITAINSRQKVIRFNSYEAPF